MPLYRKPETLGTARKPSTAKPSSPSKSRVTQSADAARRTPTPANSQQQPAVHSAAVDDFVVVRAPLTLGLAAVLRAQPNEGRCPLPRSLLRPTTGHFALHPLYPAPI